MSQHDDKVIELLSTIAELIDAQGRRVQPDLQPWAFNVNASGFNLILEGQPGQRIFVASLVMEAAGTVTATWGTGDTSFRPFPGKASLGNPGDLTMTAQNVVPLCADYPQFVLRTEPGAALALNLSTGVAVSGYLTYWKA